MRLSRVHVSGYRSVRDLEVVPGPAINVFVGANGCGKTNLYRSLYLLHAAAQGRLARTLADEGGMGSALWAGERKSRGPRRLTVIAELEGELRFTLSCGLPNQSPLHTRFAKDARVVSEELESFYEGRWFPVMERRNLSAHVRDEEGAWVDYPLQLWPNESLLSQVVEPHRYPLVSSIRQHFLSWRFYHAFRTDAEAPLREPQVPLRTPVLANDGRDLVNALQTIVENGNDVALRAAIEGAFAGADLGIEEVGGRLELTLRMPGMHRAMAARELSDGTLRYLCLVGAVLSPRPPPLLALNEPETSLHPQLHSPLARLLASASEQSQLWVTTHAQGLAERLHLAGGHVSLLGLNASGATTFEDTDNN